MAVSLADIKEQLKETSSRLSEIARTISISVLALVWLFALGGEDAPVFPSDPSPLLMFLAGGFAFLCLILDYFQYLFGYLNNRDVCKSAEASSRKEAEYDYSSFLYQARTTSFWAKQISLIVSVSFLVVMIGMALYGGRA